MRSTMGFLRMATSPLAWSFLTTRPAAAQSGHDSTWVDHQRASAAAYAAADWPAFKYHLLRIGARLARASAPPPGAPPPPCAPMPRWGSRATSPPTRASPPFAARRHGPP